MKVKHCSKKWTVWLVSLLMLVVSAAHGDDLEKIKADVKTKVFAGSFWVSVSGEMYYYFGRGGEFIQRNLDAPYAGKAELENGTYSILEVKKVDSFGLKVTSGAEDFNQVTIKITANGGNRILFFIVPYSNYSRAEVLGAGDFLRIFQLEQVDDEAAKVESKGK